MKKDRLLKKYLDRQAAGTPWVVSAEDIDNIEQVVVIPAYAEKEYLFATLASLAANPARSLQQTLLLCVVNNKADAPAAAKENNFQTLEILKYLIKERPLTRLAPALSDNLACFRAIAQSPARLGLIDASSPGREIPAGVGGVGMARKIGMDAALRLLAASLSAPRLILSLDADTLVCPDYLAKVRQAFLSPKIQTGVVACEHVLPADEKAARAICLYEIYLRFWVAGLRYARSPYAFHAIGSTMVTTAESYLAVRGMNRRAAGEDFYFLNKLAKISPVQQITQTVVYPSARVSARVPFGTGAAVGKILEGFGAKPLYYSPRIFVILKKWLSLMTQSFHRSDAEILAAAKAIDAGLTSFLDERGFFTIWPKIRANLQDQKTWLAQFHNWFDGFETFKLANYLSAGLFPRLSLSEALPEMMAIEEGEGQEATGKEEKAAASGNLSGGLSGKEDLSELGSFSQPELLKILNYWRNRDKEQTGQASAELKESQITIK